MLPPHRLLLIPRNHTTGWCAQALPDCQDPHAPWLGGISREGELVRVACTLSPFSLQPQGEPVLAELKHSLTEPEWSKRCELAQEALSRDCRKVVLARSTEFQMTEGFPLSLLGAMAQQGCASLLIEQAEGMCWIATTPETLFQRRGSQLQTEALAGTLPAEGSDRELFTHLTSCAGRRAEVEITADGIMQSLKCAGARQVRKAPLQMRRFRDWAHLCIPIHADVSGLSDTSLLQALHPSPAVCGAPRHLSGALRRCIEGKTSGWYAGACGISTPSWAHFVVVLRCAEIRGAIVRAWTGVGLVPGFCAAREWKELDLKLAGWRRLCRAAQN